jgi:hypothetical protein
MIIKPYKLGYLSLILSGLLFFYGVYQNNNTIQLTAISIELLSNGLLLLANTILLKYITMKNIKNMMEFEELISRYEKLCANCPKGKIKI